MLAPQATVSNSEGGKQTFEAITTRKKAMFVYE